MTTRGDRLRRFWGPQRHVRCNNAGKESVALDIDAEADCAKLRELTAARNPRVVYGSISGFGGSEPLADAPGYAPLVQAFSGGMSITGEPGGAPVRAGTSVIDRGTGMWLAMAVVAALRQRDATGRGCQIRTPLLETGLAWLPYQIAGYHSTGVEPQPMRSGLAILGALPGIPGSRQVPGGGGRKRRDVAQVGLGDIAGGDLGAREDLATNRRQVEQRDLVVAELSATLRNQPAAVWDALRPRGVPCSIVHRISDALTHAQTAAVGMLATMPHP